MKQKLNKLGVCLTGALVLQAVSGTLWADADQPLCLTPNELHADKTRFVETQLRVATLQCRGQGHAEMQDLYNEFVRANRSYFVAARPALQRFVARARKGSLEQYVVGLANKISSASATASQFCVKANMALEMSKKVPEPASLHSLLPIRYKAPAQKCTAR